MPKDIAVTFFQNDEFVTTVVLPRRTSFETVRQQWREVSPDSVSAFFLIESLDGDPLPQEGSLDDIVPPRKGTLGIHVLCTIEVNVRVLGAHLNAFLIRLLPRETTADLTQRVKSLFGIEEARVARLLCDGRVLDADVLPYLQLVGFPDLVLDLKLPFLACYLMPMSFHPVLYDEFGRIILNENLSEEERLGQVESADPADPLALPAFQEAIDVRALRLFASEPVRALAGAGECRATAWGSGVCIAGDETVSALVPTESILHGVPTGVVLEWRFEIRIEEKLWRRSRTVAAWPSNKLGDFLTNSNDCLLLDDQLADPHQSLWEAGLQEGSCLCVTRLLPLSVCHENGEVRRVNADLGESLFELRQRLSLSKDAFELWNGDELLLDDERSLLELKLDPTKLLIAIPRSRPVVLKVAKAKPVRVGAVQKTTTFHAFLEMASKSLKKELSRKTRFVCSCGRVFSDENAERREFPLSCCCASELCFAVAEPTRDQANQTTCRKREVSCNTITTNCDSETQTDKTECRAIFQTKKRVRRVATQMNSIGQATTLTTDDTTTETRGIAIFRIVWNIDNRGNFNFDLPFRTVVRGRKLREAISKYQGVPAGRVKLQQRRAKNKRDRTIAVEIAGGFANEQGENLWRGKVEKVEWHTIYDDDIVMTAGPERAWIRALSHDK